MASVEVTPAYLDDGIHLLPHICWETNLSANNTWQQCERFCTRKENKLEMRKKGFLQILEEARPNRNDVKRH